MAYKWTGSDVTDVSAEGGRVKCKPDHGKGNSSVPADAARAGKRGSYEDEAGASGAGNSSSNRGMKGGGDYGSM